MKESGVFAYRWSTHKTSHLRADLSRADEGIGCVCISVVDTQDFTLEGRPKPWCDL